MAKKKKAADVQAAEPKSPEAQEAQEEEKQAPAHEPREYVYVRLYANMNRWAAALLIETQERASREGAPLDVVYYHYENARWITTKNLVHSRERQALGLDPLLVLCPVCHGAKYLCALCGVERPFVPGIYLCQDDRCLTIAGPLLCASKKCAAPVSFSGKGVVDLSDKKPILNGWLRRMTDKDAELVETGKRPA